MFISMNETKKGINMKTGKLFSSALIIFTLVGAVLTGCKKDNDDDPESGSAIDNAFADAIYEDVSTMSDEAAESGVLSTFKNSSDGAVLLSVCATVTHDTLANPHTITIDFGPVNCLCHDGRYRRGMIIITYTGHYRDAGSVHTIGFDNYFVSDYQVLGTKTVTNEGPNANGYTWFSVLVNGSIVAPSGEAMTRVSSRQRVWVNGEATPQWNDDTYLISGTASGTTFSGNTFTAQITSPLVKSLDCRWIKNGIIEFTPAGKPTRIVNFGYVNGNCDRYAELTVGTHTKIIELR